MRSISILSSHILLCRLRTDVCNKRLYTFLVSPIRALCLSLTIWSWRFAWREWGNDSKPHCGLSSSRGCSASCLCEIVFPCYSAIKSDYQNTAGFLLPVVIPNDCKKSRHIPLSLLNMFKKSLSFTLLCPFYFARRTKIDLFLTL
jgi:hypothetical protein